MAAVTERQRHQIASLRHDIAATTVIATACGMLIERLACTAAEARAQLASLAAATGVPMAEMAATVIGTDPAGTAGGTVAEVVTGASAAAAASDGAELAAALAAQVAPFGASALMIWVLAADGTLELLGGAGFAEAEVARWRHIPPQLDCPARRIAAGNPDLWWLDGRPDGEHTQVIGRPEAARGVLALRDQGELIGALELYWPQPPPDRLTGDDIRRITAMAAGTARVLAVRLAHGDLTAALPRQPLFALFDQVADAVLVTRAVRAGNGEVTDFAIEHLSPGYVDPAGRNRAEIAGLTMLEAYPPGVPGHGLFRRALRVLDRDVAEHEPGLIHEPVPLAGLHAAKFRDGVIFTWRHHEAGADADLLGHVLRLAKLGGWTENLVSQAVQWTDPAFEVFGLTPAPDAAIRLGDLYSYVIGADKAAVRRFVQDLLRGTEPMTTTFRVVRPDDSTLRQIRVFAEPVSAPDGTPTMVRGAFQDVSAQYLAQVALAATRDQLADTEQRAAEDHLLALRLQRAIMPPDAHPMSVPGIDVAVRYRPVGEGHLVGGDWYDTFLLPDQRVLLVVGDVAGHGIEAVTGMVAARNALRGLAVTGASPAELLRLLNLTLYYLLSSVIGTVICGIYDPATRELRWARAGHLPPVLVRGGKAETLPLPDGILLGMDPDSDYEDVTARLRDGDTLLLYTDGLIERRNEPITAALDDLVDAAAAACGPSALVSACADKIMASAVSDTQDDACLVAVRVS
jgi:serine phosphatase RsbU (regulator of sigma subunit)